MSLKLAGLHSECKASLSTILSQKANKFFPFFIFITLGVIQVHCIKSGKQRKCLNKAKKDIFFPINDLNRCPGDEKAQALAPPSR